MIISFPVFFISSKISVLIPFTISLPSTLIQQLIQKKGKVILKKNCKIGTHSTIMPSVTIGENSIVAAYSFVTKNIPDNEIWGGIPAQLIKEII